MHGLASSSNPCFRDGTVGFALPAEGIAGIRACKKRARSLQFGSQELPSAQRKRWVSCSCIQRAAKATGGAPGTAPPVAVAPAQMRRHRNNPFQAAFHRRPVQGRTSRTGASAPIAPSKPSFRNASIPATYRTGEPRRMERRRSHPPECRRIPANPAPQSPGSGSASPSPCETCC